MKQQRYPLQWPALLLLLICLGGYPGQIPVAFSQNARVQALSVTQKLDSAEHHYYNREFQKAIEMVNICLMQTPGEKGNQIRAYHLLARIYLAQEDAVRASENIGKILNLEPQFQPTIEQDTPQFVALVSEVKAEHRPLAPKTRKRGIKKWIWIGAGSVATAAIIVLVANRNGKDVEKVIPVTEPLPEPPSFP